MRRLNQRERVFVSAMVGLGGGVLVVLVIAAVIGIAKQASDAQRLARDDARIAVLAEREQADKREACEAQNRRHDHTLGVLNHLLSMRLVGHGRAPQSVRIERERTRRATVLLIDALAPKQDC